MSNFLQQYLNKIQFNKEDLKDFKSIGAIIIQKGKVLMMDHVKFNFWTIPIGKVKTNESVIEGLKNEVKEELDIVVIDYKLLNIWKRTFLWHGKKVKTENYLFKINKWNGRIKNNEPHKHRAIKFMTIDEIKRKKISIMTEVMLKLYNKGKLKI